MKILMSLLEVTELVRRTYNLPETAELEVTNQNHSDALTLESTFYRLGYLNHETQDIRPDQKIAAIKKLRELASQNPTRITCGLAVAKAAIEDWKRFFAYVSRKGYPIMDGTVVSPWAD